MVRLRDLYQINKASVTQFQFLYGAIERGELKSKLVGPREFQFLYGAIESLNLRNLCGVGYAISIPVWCD